MFGLLNTQVNTITPEGITIRREQKYHFDTESTTHEDLTTLFQRTFGQDSGDQVTFDQLFSYFSNRIRQSLVVSLWLKITNNS